MFITREFYTMMGWDQQKVIIYMPTQVCQGMFIYDKGGHRTRAGMFYTTKKGIGFIPTYDILCSYYYRKHSDILLNNHGVFTQ